MLFLLARFLERTIRKGRLTLISAAGDTREFGPGAGPAVVVRLHDHRLPWRLLLNPSLHLGEAYMARTLTLEHGSLVDLLHMCLAGDPMPERHRLAALRHAFMRLVRAVRYANSRRRARRNAAHHYDRSCDLYQLFLDADLQYSCGYFADGADSLEEAQEHKKRLVATKLLLEPGMSVLDIGCGWGGLALYLARTAGADVTGLTLANEQLDVARVRASKEGLSERVHFFLRDYREQPGTFDRVVSVGMFEHVGPPHYATFFSRLRRLLKPDGVALLHAIGRMAPPDVSDAWIEKHIFPGGYCPALSEVLGAIEGSGLWVTDVEILRLHYAQTLRCWSERFQSRRSAAEALYGDRFCRMWEFYLALSEVAFRDGPMMVFQIQIARRRDAVPLVREYIGSAASGNGSPARRALESAPAA